MRRKTRIKNMSLALYEIAVQHRAMVDALLDITDDAQTIKDTIEAESYPLEIKVRQVAYAPKMLDASADQIDLAVKDMQARAKAMRNRATNIREYIKTSMEIARVSKIDCPHFSISIKNNPPSVDIFEPSLIPAEYMRQPETPPPAPDKTAIKAAIKAGIEVSGAVMVSGTRIEIK